MPKIFKILFSVFIFVAVSFILYSSVYRLFVDKKDSKKELIEDVVLNSNIPSFFQDSIPTKENVMESLLFFDIQHPEIVLAQSILETGNYRHLNNNNLFGLYDSSAGRYFAYDHWTESVSAYKNKIQHRYKGNDNPNDYFLFLKKIGYAEAVNYESVLKQILQEGI